MKVTTERLEDCQINVFVELDAADVDKELRQTARKLSRNYNIPGYRRGRAPFHAVIRIFGREAVQQAALEEFGQDLYDKAMDVLLKLEKQSPDNKGVRQKIEDLRMLMNLSKRGGAP